MSSKETKELILLEAEAIKKGRSDLDAIIKKHRRERMTQGDKFFDFWENKVIPTFWIGLFVWAMLAFLGLVQAQTLPLPQPHPNVAQGKRLFEKNCAGCHGIDLKGSDKGPPFLHPVYESAHHGDAAFQMAVKHGSKAHHWRFGDMPPVPALTPDEVVHITSYVRQVQRQNGIN